MSLTSEHLTSSLCTCYSGMVRSSHVGFYTWGSFTWVYKESMQSVLWFMLRTRDRKKRSEITDQPLTPSSPILNYDEGWWRTFRDTVWWEGECCEALRSEGGRREDDGSRGAQTHMEWAAGLRPGLGGVRGGAEQCVEVPLPVLQQRWRWDCGGWLEQGASPLSENNSL